MSAHSGRQTHLRLVAKIGAVASAIVTTALVSFVLGLLCAASWRLP